MYCLACFVVVISMCLLYVKLGSRVGPSIFGLMFMGSVMLSICSSSCVLYFAGSGVKRVYVVSSGLRMRLFVCVHVWIVLVESSCDGVVYVVLCCTCRVVAFEAMLCGDMWDVVCDVWE